MDGMSAKCTTEQFKPAEIMLPAARRWRWPPRGRFPEGAIPGHARPGGHRTPQGDVTIWARTSLGWCSPPRASGVVDCARDCPRSLTWSPPPRANRPFAVLASGLISPLFRWCASCADCCARRGLSNVAVVAGGAALKQCTAEALNVDYVARDAFDCVHFLEGLPR